MQTGQQEESHTEGDEENSQDVKPDVLEEDNSEDAFMVQYEDEEDDDDEDDEGDVDDPDFEIKPKLSRKRESEGDKTTVCNICDRTFKTNSVMDIFFLFQLNLNLTLFKPKVMIFFLLGITTTCHCLSY